MSEEDPIPVMPLYLLFCSVAFILFIRFCL